MKSKEFKLWTPSYSADELEITIYNSGVAPAVRLTRIEMFGSKLAQLFSLVTNVPLQ